MLVSESVKVLVRNSASFSNALVQAELLNYHDSIMTVVWNIPPYALPEYRFQHLDFGSEFLYLQEIQRKGICELSAGCG